MDARFWSLFWTVLLVTTEPSPIKIESDSHLLAYEMLQVLIESKAQFSCFDRRKEL